MNYTTLKIKNEKSFITVTIDRPEKLNALSQRVLQELKHFLTSIHNISVKGLILTGAGEKAFVAGADIHEMSFMNANEGEAFGKLGQEVTELLESLPVPIIACVNGFAFGGGCELAMGCDYIYATETAVFGQPEVNLGLIPGFGGCVRLSRYVGPGRAKEMIYTGCRVNAREAERIGLVNKVFSTIEEALEAAFQSLEEIATKSSYAVSLCKHVINYSSGRTIKEGLLEEKIAFRSAFTSEDMVEGTSAFLNKRKPNF